LKAQFRAKHGAAAMKGDTMSSIPLTVVLHGLIALVPTPSPTGGHLMTALLLDQTTPSPGMECMFEHSPKLKFNVPRATQVQCFDAGCDLDGLECICTEGLQGRRVSLEITPSPDLSAPLPKSRLFLPELPATVADAGDFSYVANLSLQPFGQVLNTAYLSATPPQDLFARMDVPFHTVTACALAAREDFGVSHIQPFSFHKLHAQGTAGEGSQAIAQMVVAQVDVPDAAGGTQQVKLHLTDSQGDHSVVIDPVNGGYAIELSNDSTVLDRDDSCEDGVGRHFAMYYGLAVSPPLMANRLIPHARYTDGKSAGDFLPSVCRLPFKNPMDRPVCPIVTFNP
jgi:hypothetical protein